MRSNSADESGVSYDRTKSVFVGNLPFDVSDEEVIEIFTKNKEYKRVKDGVGGGESSTGQNDQKWERYRVRFV